MKRRVAITGLGAVSPLGNDVPTTWKNLIAGYSGIDIIKQFDASAFPTYIASEVKNFSPGVSLSGKHTRFVMPFTHFALEAARQAFEDAAILPTEQTSSRWGVVTGSGMMTAEFEYLQRFQQTCAVDGDIDWGKLHAQARDFYKLADFGKTTSNSGLSLLIQQYGITGYSSSVHTACASGGQALGWQCKLFVEVMLILCWQVDLIL
nr:beta-ketoacyl synthase N-terminal-like domain-containing protein [Legionella norrlandica]